MNSHHPDDGNGVGLRNVGLYNSSVATICPIRFYRVPLSQKLQDIHNVLYILHSSLGIWSRELAYTYITCDNAEALPKSFFFTFSEV